MRKVLVTGATGKVGARFIDQLLASDMHRDVTVRALLHNRSLPAHPRVETLQGNIADRVTAHAAMQGVTHVIHCATCKETPDEVMDVAVKGLFHLLEEGRTSADLQRFILIGGDAAVGHFFYPKRNPVTEAEPHSAYPGCYALSKVIEEVMLEQYGIQYGLDWCCLRAPWIMEKDDFRYSLSFGDDVFGGPRWKDIVGPQLADMYRQQGSVPLMLDADGSPMKRNFVHIDDLVDAMLIALDHPAAMQQLFNICMDEPVDYGEVALHLQRSRNISAVPVATPYHSTWLDNSKAKSMLGWRPKYDLARLVDSSWDYQRDESDPRIVWYPG